MKLATTLRESLGLTQHQLTGFIGGNRSVLTRAEKNERSLTPAATLNLLTLFQVHAETPAQNAVETIAPSLVDGWKVHAQTCRYKVKALQIKLADAREAHSKACRLQNCLVHLLQTKAGELSTKQLRWVEEQSYQARKKIQAMGNGRQQELALAIAALEAEAVIYENAVAPV